MGIPSPQMRAKAMRLPDRTRQDSSAFGKLSIDFLDQRFNVWITSLDSLIEKECPKDKQVLSGFFGQHD